MGKGESIEAEGSGERRVVYCVVPRELAARLHDSLRRHFRDRADVEVIVEQRVAERRRLADRRGSADDPAPAAERRKVRAASGRRIGDRRSAVALVDEPPPLPRMARRFAERLAFVERLEPSGQLLEDRDTARLVTRFQAGDREAFAMLYERYFDRVYGYLRVTLRDADEAEDAAQQIFMKVFSALPRYERRSQPFRAWLFTVVRNHAISQLHKRRRLDVVSPEELTARRGDENDSGEQTAAWILDWISDRELHLFIERLPEAQRRIITMRYLLGLTTAEIGQVLDRNPDAIRRAESRALQFLRDRLAAVGRRGAHRHRAQSQVYLRQARVVRVRRFALNFNGPTG